MCRRNSLLVIVADLGGGSGGAFFFAGAPGFRWRDSSPAMYCLNCRSFTIQVSALPNGLFLATLAFPMLKTDHARASELPTTIKVVMM